MKLSLLKGYVQAIVSGLIILAAVLLVALQWDQVAGFSLFGKRYDIVVVNDDVRGGVNTALLMLFSAIGGVVLYFLVKVLFHGALTLRKGFRAAPGGAGASGK